MRISDWSSDVCSSDLGNPRSFADRAHRPEGGVVHKGSGGRGLPTESRRKWHLRHNVYLMLSKETLFSNIFQLVRQSCLNYGQPCADRSSARLVSRTTMLIYKLVHRIRGYL